MILDPIQAYLGGGIDMNRANEARDMTKRLGALAEKYKCAIILIGHMNKASPIDKYVESIENGKRVNRMDLAGDVIIILMLKPLVLSGIIGFFSVYICLCEKCLKKIITRENELQEKLLKISELMHKETSESISCNLSRDSNGIAYLAVRGAERLGLLAPKDPPGSL